MVQVQMLLPILISQLVAKHTLILFQVTEDGQIRSTLDGTIEVFGGEAGIIIANPNGIECNGCAFINANRVDLVDWYL